MFIYNISVMKVRSFVIGGFLAFLGYSMGLQAMESCENMDLTEIGVKSPKILSHQSPVRITKKLFGTENLVSYWYKSEYVPMPTWQDIVKLIYQGKLTSEILERYVRGRIDERIAYYRWLLSDKQFKKLSKEQIDKIPPCVRYSTSLSSYDLLDKAFVYSDGKAKRVYEQLGLKKSWKERSAEVAAHAFAPYIFVDDFCSEIVIGHIEHEIAHLFQRANSVMIKQARFSRDVIPYKLSNSHANMIIQKQGEVKVVMNSDVNAQTKDLETEADQAMAVFIPNNEILRRFCLCMIQNNQDSEHCDFGYLSKSALLEYNKKFHYRGGDGVQEMIVLGDELKGLENNMSLSKQSYERNLNKNLNREFLEKVYEEL